MKYLRKTVFLTIYTIVTIALSSYLTVRHIEKTDKIKSSSIDTQSDIPSEARVMGNLKKEYFDDLNSLWGHIDENNKYIPEAFSSEYSSRTIPKPIQDPTLINQDRVEISLVNRDKIKPPFGVPEGPDKGKFTGEESKAVENNYSEYGNLLGGFFSNRGEEIYSVVKADVDKDKLEEKLIVTAQIGGNHPPNNGYIVKNNTIVASVSFAAGTIYPAKDGNGFYIEKPDYSDAPMCCPKRNLIIRVVYENGEFVPVWEQKIENLSF